MALSPGDTVPQFDPAAKLAVVEVKSSWWSKINWTQVVAMVSGAAVFFGGAKYAIPLETQVALVTTIVFVQGFVTMIFKTFFTKTVTPASLPANTPLIRPSWH